MAFDVSYSSCNGALLDLAVPKIPFAGSKDHLPFSLTGGVNKVEKHRPPSPANSFLLEVAQVPRVWYYSLCMVIFVCSNSSASNTHLNRQDETLRTCS